MQARPIELATGDSECVIGPAPPPWHPTNFDSVGLLSLATNCRRARDSRRLTKRATDKYDRDTQAAEREVDAIGMSCRCV